MDKLSPIFWILGAILLYVAAIFVIVLLLDAVRHRDFRSAMQAVMALVPSGLCFALLHTSSSMQLFIDALLASICLIMVSAAREKKETDWKRTKERNEAKRQVFTHLVLLTGSVAFLLPFLWLLTTSFKEEDEMLKFPPVWIPTQQVKVMDHGQSCGLSTMMLAGKKVKVAELADLDNGQKKIRVLPDQPDAGKEMIVDPASVVKIRKPGLKWQNYTDALNFLPPQTHKGLIYLWNTLYITLLSILGICLSSSMVAYSFARLKWPGKNVLFVVLLATMMLPGAVTMMPVFLIFRALGWIDTLRPLWVPAFFGGAFNIFLLRQFFMTIPGDLEEAAKIDGAGYWTTYWRIMLPQIKPALAAVTIMQFMGSWNDFMGPLIYLSSPEKMTLSYGLQLFQGDHGSEFGMVMAASTLVMLPVLVIFFLAQKHFIEGITLTGIKG